MTKSTITKKTRTKPYSEDNRVDIPQAVMAKLLVKSGGRCEYLRCNKPLWRDDLTLTDLNRASVAHIVDVNKHTHRFDAAQSPKLAKEFSNLMLLCQEHHRLIDHEEEALHTVPRLHAMKQSHEQRIVMLTGIQQENRSHVVLYGANVGEHAPSIRLNRAAWAMAPDYYPAEEDPIDLGLCDSAKKDDDPGFWMLERDNLRARFSERVAQRLARGGISHLSVFGIAPMPILMELGRLLGDIHPADSYGQFDDDTYQLKREPPDWGWQDHPEDFKFLIDRPTSHHAAVALNISFSAIIDNRRITSVMSEDVSIWTLTVSAPGNDFLKSRQQLRMFRQVMRALFVELRSHYPMDTTLHIFPAMPVSTAVDLGRVWMPKADLGVKIYDQNWKLKGFREALTFDRQPNGGTP